MVGYVARSVTSSERRGRSLDIVLDAMPRSVSTARHAVRELLDPAGLIPVEVIEDVMLLVSELVTNAVLHAKTAVRVRAWAEVGRVTVAVGDNDPLHGPRWSDRGPMATSGRGMRLVDLLASSWGIEVRETSKFVWFESAYGPQLVGSR